MDRAEFNARVRPALVEIPIGKQGKAFDRVDLDAWADWHKSEHGKPPQFEDRQALLGHKSQSVTTDYSAAEIGHLIEQANKVLKLNASTPTLTVLGTRMAS